MADGIVELLQKNIIYIVGAIAIFALVFMVMKLRSKAGKPLDRASLERKKRIGELRFNDTSIARKVFDNIYYERYAWLYHGKKCIGRVRNIFVTTRPLNKAVIKKKEGEEIELADLKLTEPKPNGRFFEIVFNPILMNLMNIHLINPMKKELIRVASSETTLIPMENALGYGRGEIHISSAFPIDFKMGWHFGLGEELDEVAFIHDRIHETDFEQLGSRYYIESQKHSVIDKDYSGQAMLKEKEIDEIRAKQKSVTKSV